MSCIRIEHGFICTHPSYRLRLLDGRYIYMEWHNYFGPTIYHDKDLSRSNDEWYKDTLICTAIEWFQKRGHKA